MVDSYTEPMRLLSLPPIIYIRPFELCTRKPTINLLSQYQRLKKPCDINISLGGASSLSKLGGPPTCSSNRSIRPSATKPNPLNAKYNRTPEIPPRASKPQISFRMLYTHATLITHQPLPGNHPRWRAILVHGNKIADIAKTETLKAKHPHEEIVDLSGSIIFPGLVRTHMHTAQNIIARSVRLSLPVSLSTVRIIQATMKCYA
jgi:hypothetical protein